MLYEVITMFAAGIGHDLEIVRRKTKRDKKGAPGNAQTGRLECLGHGQGMIDVRVEGGIGEKEIFGPNSFQTQGGTGHGLRLDQAVRPSLDAGIGAVEAAESTPPFALQVEHAAVFEIKTDV